MDKKEIIILIVVVLLAGIQYAVRTPGFLKGRPLPAETAVKPDPFAGMEIEAKSAIVWDALDDKILFAKNENVQLPLASLAKIMTARVALKGGMDVAVVTKEAIREEGDNGLLVGEEWWVPDLTRLTLVSSSNDGAHSLAAAWVAVKEASGEKFSFVDAMNEEAKSLGLAETYFLNETGLDVSSSVSGAYGSAKEIAKLLYATVTMYPNIFEATSKGKIKALSIGDKIHELKNTNGGVEKTIGIVASKTGYTTLAGGNLAIVIDAGVMHPVVVAVLGSSEDGRFTDVSKLVDAAVQAVSI
jgi:D-alanyl-D-alanine carboxypeptidase